MKALQFLKTYKLGATGGLLYGIVGFITIYGLGLCQMSSGACVMFSPLVFHQSVVQLISAAWATPLFLIPLNTVIFIFEGAFIEKLVTKLK